MKLIADSGSTKTDWVLTDGRGIVAQVQTQGINPFHQAEDDISRILQKELLPLLAPHESLLASGLTVHFYGSGVRPELEPLMERLLRSALPSATAVEAHGDLLGAARAVCGADEGIACILGTGANSCLYNGCSITQNTPPLGYILGDEGSGAVLGISFLNALYKGFLPASLVADFESEYQLSMADVIARVYRQPMANRFLASLSPFISRHLDESGVCELVVDNFRRFFRRNLSQYGRRDLPVGFVGSIASCYEPQLRQAAEAEGFVVGRVVKSPMEGLLAYHRVTMKAALFDLDGVVFDTEPQYTVFWGSQCRLYHPEHPGLEHEIKGSTLTQIYDRWFSGELEKEQAAITERLDAFEAQMTFEYMAGFEALIADLHAHGVKTAVVTSSNQPKMESVYRAQPAFKQLFDAILTSEDFARSKPHPDCYLTAAKRFGVMPEECVVFEDSFNGLKSGRGAGMKVVGVATTNPKEAIAELSDVQITDYSRVDYESLLKLF